jgi:hypothetical protein
MNVKIETKAAQFPEKEYINGTFLAVYHRLLLTRTYPRKGRFCSFRFREIDPLRSDMRRCGENLVTPVWFNCLTGFSHLLLIGNASTNFLIYCSLRSTASS